MTREHPILFSAPMINAILDGRKTQTRRVVTIPSKRIAKKYGDVLVYNVSYYAPPSGRSQQGWADPGINYHTYDPKDMEMIGNHIDPCPYGQPDDQLWVRETWSSLECLDRAKPAQVSVGSPIFYHADKKWVHHHEDRQIEHVHTPHEWAGKKRPSIFMPRWASRIDLLIKDTRVERLQDISVNDAIAEGIKSNDYAWRNYSVDLSSAQAFGMVPQDSFKTLWDSINAKTHPWQSNPWVWVIDFERIKP